MSHVSHADDHTRRGLDAAIAAALIAAEGVQRATDVVEAMHARLGWPLRHDVERGRTRGFAGLVYRGIRLGTRGASGALRLVARRGGPVPLGDARREAAARAVVNGVIGDHLAETGNPLAIPMVLRRGGRTLPLDGDAPAAALAAALPAATPRIVVLIHGLCMNDLQWDADGSGGHGEALARDLGYTPVYLHYNTGLHISRNGRALAALLDALVRAWPVQVERLAIVAHSMGGMVARSACAQAAPGSAWRAHLRTLVFLATPHHGAPLERAGHAFETALAALPYAAPLARVGRLRSAGITDLRHGNLLDEDWAERDRFASGADTRTAVPLPDDVACYAIAATRGGAPHGLAARGRGDGLVPLHSALGEHADPRHRLAFPPTHRWIAPRTNHLALLHRAEVYARLRHWLGD